MQIIDQNNNAVLAKDGCIASTFSERIVGLLNRKEFHPGQALILKHCNSIHTFFMRFPIDVLFVDKNKKIVKVISALKPFRISPIYFHASLVIELPTGTIQSQSIKEGDMLLFK